MSKRDISFYIIDIFIAIDKINRFTKGFNSVDEFILRELNWDATIRELEIIGEAIKHLLNDNILPKYYRRVVDFRNQINHAYFGIDENIVWDVIQNKIPQLYNDLKQIVERRQIDLTEAINSAKEDKYTTEDTKLFLDTLY